MGTVILNCSGRLSGKVKMTLSRKSLITFLSQFCFLSSPPLFPPLVLSFPFLPFSPPSSFSVCLNWEQVRRKSLPPFSLSSEVVFVPLETS